MGTLVGTPLFAEQVASNTTACSVSKAWTAGNSIIWFWVCEHQTATVTVAGSTNTNEERSDNGLPVAVALPWQMRAGVMLNIAGGTYAVTATPSTACAFKAFGAVEFSGHALASAVEFGDALNEATGTTRNAGSSRANSAAGTVIAMGMDYDVIATPSAGAGYTSAGTGWRFGGGTDMGRMEYLAVGGAGSQLATFGMNNGAESFCAMLFLLDAGGGGGATGRGRLVHGKLVGGNLVSSHHA